MKIKNIHLLSLITVFACYAGEPYSAGNENNHGGIFDGYTDLKFFPERNSENICSLKLRTGASAYCCKKCLAVSPTVTGMKTHVQTCKGSLESPAQHTFCNMTIQGHPVEYFTQKLSSKSKTTGNKNLCMYCKDLRTFETKETFTTHIEKEHNYGLLCNVLTLPRMWENTTVETLRQAIIESRRQVPVTHVPMYQLDMFLNQASPLPSVVDNQLPPLVLASSAWMADQSCNFSQPPVMNGNSQQSMINEQDQWRHSMSRLYPQAPGMQPSYSLMPTSNTMPAATQRAASCAPQDMTNVATSVNPIENNSSYMPSVSQAQSVQSDLQQPSNQINQKNQKLDQFMKKMEEVKNESMEENDQDNDKPNLSCEELMAIVQELQGKSNLLVCDGQGVIDQPAVYSSSDNSESYKHSTSASQGASAHSMSVQTEMNTSISNQISTQTDAPLNDPETEDDFSAYAHRLSQEPQQSITSHLWHTFSTLFSPVEETTPSNARERLLDIFRYVNSCSGSRPAIPSQPDGIVIEEDAAVIPMDTSYKSEALPIDNSTHYLDSDDDLKKEYFSKKRRLEEQVIQENVPSTVMDVTELQDTTAGMNQTVVTPEWIEANMQEVGTTTIASEMKQSVTDANVIATWNNPFFESERGKKYKELQQTGLTAKEAMVEYLSDLIAQYAQEMDVNISSESSGGSEKQKENHTNKINAWRESIKKEHPHLTSDDVDILAIVTAFKEKIKELPHEKNEDENEEDEYCPATPVIKKSRWNFDDPSDAVRNNVSMLENATVAQHIIQQEDDNDSSEVVSLLSENGQEHHELENRTHIIPKKKKRKTKAKFTHHKTHLGPIIANKKFKLELQKRYEESKEEERRQSSATSAVIPSHAQKIQITWEDSD